MMIRWARPPARVAEAIFRKIFSFFSTDPCKNVALTDELPVECSAEPGRPAGPILGDKIMNLFKSPFGRTAQKSAASSRPCLERLEGRDMPSTLPIMPLIGPASGKLSDLVQKWFYGADLSKFGDAVQQTPQITKNIPVDIADGTYTVRFFEYDLSTHTIVSDHVTVNSQPPVNWVALVEKAYAQLAEGSRAGAITLTDLISDGHAKVFKPI